MTTVRRPADMRQRLSANWATHIDDEMQRDAWSDLHHLAVEPECLADLEDVSRVMLDVEREGHHPAEFDCIGIAAELRQAAGDRHLDAAGDDVWVDALEWHRRAPFPVEVV